MQISVSFVVHSFSIYWKCELSGSISEELLPSFWKKVMVVLVLNLVLIVFYLAWGSRNDGVEDKYSVLIRFDDQSSTDAFYKHFNGRHFSSLEVCFSLSYFLYFPLMLKSFLWKLVLLSWMFIFCLFSCVYRWRLVMYFLRLMCSTQVQLNMHRVHLQAQQSSPHV